MLEKLLQAAILTFLLNLIAVLSTPSVPQETSAVPGWENSTLKLNLVQRGLWWTEY